MKQSRSYQSGFTLVEMMIASSLAVLIIAMMMTSFMTLARAATSSTAHTRIHGEMRHAMDVIERDLRAGIRVIWVSPETGGIGATIKTETGDKDLYIWKNGNILYRWQSGNLNELASGVSKANFTMLDTDGNTTAVMANANAIDITLSGETSVLSTRCMDTLQTRVTMRNNDD